LSHPTGWRVRARLFPAGMKHYRIAPTSRHFSHTERHSDPEFLTSGLPTIWDQRH
jgi:hypothetical protein